MPNYVSTEEPETSRGAIVEGRDIGRPVVADLGVELGRVIDPEDRDIAVAEPQFSTTGNAMYEACLAE
jgi:hypothetical protein